MRAVATHTHPVDWLEREMPYAAFDEELQRKFGVQGTVRLIGGEEEATSIMSVVEEEPGELPIGLVLKWTPKKEPKTIEFHRAVAEEHGAVWWGRTAAKEDQTGLAQNWVDALHSQIGAGIETPVFLHSPSASTWRAEMLDVSSDEPTETNLIPDYYSAADHHSLWVKLQNLHEVDPQEIKDGFVKAIDGAPVTDGGLGNQSPMIIRALPEGTRRGSRSTSTPQA